MAFTPLKTNTGAETGARAPDSLSALLVHVILLPALIRVCLRSVFPKVQDFGVSVGQCCERCCREDSSHVQETPVKVGSSCGAKLNQARFRSACAGRTEPHGGRSGVYCRGALAVPGLTEPLPSHGQLSRLVPGVPRCKAAGDTGTSGGSASGSRTGEHTDSLCKLAARLRSARLG